VQLGHLAAFPPGDAREDWTIVRALSAVVGTPLPYDNLGEVRRRLVELNPVFAAIDQVTRAPWAEFGAPGALDPAPLGVAVDNYYMTDPISRASETMAKCTEVFVLGQNAKATGTHG